MGFCTVSRFDKNHFNLSSRNNGQPHPGTKDGSGCSANVILVSLTKESSEGVDTTLNPFETAA